MSDYEYEISQTASEAPPPAESRWGRLSTFMLGLALGAVLGLAATPVGRGALIPVRWFQSLSQDETADAPAPARPAVLAQKANLTRPAAPAQPAAAAPVLPATEPPPQLRAPIAGAPLVVGVFGDSMADGLWAGLYRQLHDQGPFQVVRFSQSSTGLARYDYVDMQQKTQSDLDSRHIDVAVLMFGTNDEQGIATGGKVYDFGTPGWRTIYEARIDALVELLRSRGVAVYWVGLPKMERKGFDARAMQVNDILAGRMAALGVPFISTIPATVNEQGQYDDYLAPPGSSKKVLMRARDGIHMTMAGYIRIAGPVAQRLKADVAAVSRASASAVSLAGETQVGSRP